MTHAAKYMPSATTHRGWCDPTRCEADTNGSGGWHVLHWGERIVWEDDEGRTASVQMSQVDDDASGAEQASVTFDVSEIPLSLTELAGLGESLRNVVPALVRAIDDEDDAS